MMCKTGVQIYPRFGRLKLTPPNDAKTYLISHHLYPWSGLMDPQYIFIAFAGISLVAGVAAMFLWVLVYRNVQKGSVAWLLLALTAIFLITASIFPMITIQYSGDREYVGEFLMEGMVWSVPEADEVSNLFGKSVLIEYTPESRYEDAVIEITLRIFGECRNAVLVSNEPRVSEYKSRLHDLVDMGAMKFVEISATAEEISESDGIVTLPLNRIDQFANLFEQLPEGLWIIFEPISHIISEHGVDKAYDAISKSIEIFSHKQFNVVGLINKDAHEKDVVSKFEGLFINQALLTTDKIRVQKGKKEDEKNGEE
jgi:hypothetical protein